MYLDLVSTQWEGVLMALLAGLTCCSRECRMWARPLLVRMQAQAVSVGARSPVANVGS